MPEGDVFPVALIHNLSNGYKLSQALYAVAKLGVADLIGTRADIDFAKPHGSICPLVQTQ